MHTLTIVALSTPQTIGIASLDCCKRTPQLFTQTNETPCILPLTEAGLCFSTMDDLYANAEDFDALNEAIIQRLIAACEQDDVVYAVPGRGPGGLLTPLREAAQGAAVRMICLPGVGYAQAAAATAGMDADAVALAVAGALPEQLDTRVLLSIEEIDTRIRAGEIKLQLLEYYPAAHGVLLCSMKPDGTYKTCELPLFELDRQHAYHATTVLLVPPVDMLSLERFGYRELKRVMHTLRSPGGCPWDAEQTHETLKKSLIEECYETLDAIDSADDAALCEELGDVLLQCVFHAEIAATQGRFDERDISTGIVQKLIYRHPHIFGAERVNTADDVLNKWEQLKKTEKHHMTQTEVLCAVPRGLPALMRGAKVQKAAAQVGFDWACAADAFYKIVEETAELALAMQGQGNVVEELGDLLFAVVNVSRLSRLDAEDALQRASEKFIARFAAMEALAASRGLNLLNLPLSEQNVLWNEVKSAQIGLK